MTTGTLVRLAWRESRTARRRLLLYMSSISLGVAALVAIDSFSGNVTRSIHEQSRTLLGGDLAVQSREPFTPKTEALLDSLARTGTPVARLTSFASMALVPRTHGTRLVQVRAASPGYPFYGRVVTEPASAWSALQRSANAVVDPSLLVALDARVGDSLVLGYARFRITGIIRSVPGNPGITAALGPRVFIPARYVPETQLLVFGSRAEYEALLKLRAMADPDDVARSLRPQVRESRARIRTVGEAEQDLTKAVDRLSQFLGIVGLAALLLGGVGVASGVSAFVNGKIETAAVFRCLGATGPQVLAIYLVQAAVMGLAGAVVGAALGVAMQFGLPGIIRDFLPIDVRPSVQPRAVATGLAVGVWVAIAFALRPLLALRRVSPLQALRRDVDESARAPAWRDPLRLSVDTLLGASVVAIALARATTPRQGLLMSGGIALAIAALWVGAAGLATAARRLLRAHWPYVVRQGIANLHRPANQTRAVVVSLGFGVFLIATLYVVQASLLGEFRAIANASSGNVLFYDVQEDQAEGVGALVRAAATGTVLQTPIVTMRIAAINGRPAESLVNNGERRAEWALRREYRSTFRDTLVPSEHLVGGRWLGAAAPRARDGDEVSFEAGVARELRLRLGDTVTWDVQGVRVPTRVTSLRDVDWARFEPNFFAVLSPGAVAQAPKQFIVLANVPDALQLARLQRAVVDRYPNVSSIDLTLIRQTVTSILRRVTLAVRFMALFSLGMGLPVLFSAVVATRRERVREGVLLKTLGATRAQVERIMLAEYVALGVLGSALGALLASAAGWALVHFVFKLSFTPAPLPTLVIAAVTTTLTVTIGWVSGRDVFAVTPNAALREV